MASTIDFATLDDVELLYGYQRVNRSRFPDNFMACAEEIVKRGLSTPEKFEIEPMISGGMTSTLLESISSLAQALTKRLPSPQA